MPQARRAERFGAAGHSGVGSAPSLATMSPRISIRLLAAQSDQRLVALVSEGH